MASAQASPTRTYDFTAGSNAVADNVDTDLNTLYTVLQGGVGNVHIADDAAIALSKLQQAAWTSFTPTITAVSANPAIGNGTLTGYYQKVGRIVSAYVSFTYGSTTTTGTGDLRFALPVTMSSTVPALQCMGSCNVVDSGTRAFVGYMRRVSTTTVEAELINSAGSGTVIADFSANDPHTWATGDQITFTITYEAAA